VAAQPDTDIGAALAAALRLHQAGRIDEAARQYQSILEREPQHAGALHLLGLCAHQRGDQRTATELISRAIERAPSDAVMRNNLGAVRLADHAAGEALASFDAAIAINPGYAEAWNNRGNALADLHRPDEALAAYGQASALGWRQPQLAYNEANLLQQLGRHAEAVERYRAVLSALPGFHDGWYNLAAVLEKLGQSNEADQAYRRAAAGARNPAAALASLLFLRLRQCDWTDYPALRTAVLACVDRRLPGIEPFKVLAIGSTADQQRTCAGTHAAASQPSPPAAVGSRIRIGYFSADFHNHATAHLLAEVLERHDRERFDIVAYSFGPPSEDVWRQRLRTAVPDWHEVGGLTDEAIAALARQHGIDIAVDLKGYTADARPGIFAWRAAPVQVNYLGYPGTLGTAHHDYLIADPVLVMPGEEGHYTEKIAWLPDTYQPNDSTKLIAPLTPARRDLGLPDDGFVFCSFNNSFKITPDVFLIWMALLQAVPGSVLWLLACGTSAETNLRREAARQGVAGERLVFAPRLPLAEHLARQRAADLFLDTFHYNAHTTASDALWAGLPLLTCRGGTFASRVAASLLSAIGLEELIAADPTAYEGLALALARQPERLREIRSRLAAHRQSAALFDCVRYTRHLEALYLRMHERRCAGLPPDHLPV
jgi:predicted O-linked N-acetylglucosamine transferase (SPINDLY family)